MKSPSGFEQASSVSGFSPEPRSSALLERHQRRREEQGIPTLTVLLGPPGQALSLLRQWLEARGQPLCTTVASSSLEAFHTWMEAVARARNLAADAADWLGAASGHGPGELHARLVGKPAPERDVLLKELFPASRAGDAASACRCVLQSPGPGRVENLSRALLAACDGEPTRALAAVHALLPARAAPALLMAGQGPEWLARAARTASRLCAAVPTLTVALSTGRSDAETFLASGQSQDRAMVREGLMELEAPSPQELKRRLSALGVRDTEALSASLARLAADGAPDDVVTRFGHAAREREAAAFHPESADGARSEAERFLFGLLEALPDTRGLFELNGRAEFLIHQRPVEVDFLSRLLRVALEVDGYYHFQNPEAYRRDRRKDLALQRHGYLVLRVLADDVVPRLEEIRNTLQEVVAERRHLVVSHGGDADGGS